jgi:hypothetical protein
MTIDAIPADAPTPQSRAKGEPDGIPVVFGDGQTWMIPRFGLAKGLTSMRDEVFESLLIKRSISHADVRAAAYYGLAVNYDLSDTEIREIIQATDPGTIAEVICESLIPLEPARRTFTAWARSALLANGLMPSEVPAEDLPHVLDQLVRTGRAVKLADYTDVGRGVAARANLIDMLTTD